MRRLSILLLFAVGSSLSAGDWPTWRGPSGQGLCDETGLPLKWSATENVKWKVPLAHPGNSTPAVWKDHIFLTMANRGGSVRSLLCFNRADGSLRWQMDVSFAGKEKNWDQNWYANASPTTDGERVVVSFGSAGMFCYDFGGNERWRRTDLGRWEHQFGNASSPIFYRDLAILWCGPNEGDGRNVLLAVNKKTGKTVWERLEVYGSWATPLIADVNGKEQLLLGASRDAKSLPEEQHGFLKGYDPATGKELWRCRGLSSYVYTSALYADGVAVEMSGYGGSALAVKLGGTGDIGVDRLWLHPTSSQRIGSGVIVGGHVYAVDENATSHCYDLKTGVDRWKQAPRLKGGSTWGSMVAAEGRLYVMMRDGRTNVLAADPSFKILAVNRLAENEETNSSPAMSGGQIFLRTFKHLWCIEAKR